MQTSIKARLSPPTLNPDPRPQPGTLAGAEHLRDPSRPRSGQFAAASGGTGATPAVQAPRASQAEAVAQLRPPSSWWRRFLGSFFLGPKASQLESASRLHAQVRAGSSPGQTTAVARPAISDGLAALIQGEANGKPYESFDRMTGRLNPDAPPQGLPSWLDARAFLLAAPSQDDALRAIRTCLAPSGGVRQPQAQLETRARTVYLALVDAVRRHGQSPSVLKAQAQQAPEAAHGSGSVHSPSLALSPGDEAAARRQRSQAAALAFSRELDLACQAKPGGQDLAARLERLDLLEASLPALQDLEAADRTHCTFLLAERRGQIEPDRAALEKMLAKVTEGKTWEPLREALPARRSQWEDLRKALPLCRQLDTPSRAALNSVLQDTGARLALLETRDTDLAALQVEAPRMGSALATLAPQDYLHARSSLVLLLARLPATPRDLLIKHLDTRIGHAAQTRWLSDMAAGDAEVIDIVFKGAQWHEDALALKLAVIAPDDSTALRNLDVQCNLRMVADELDAFMASRNVAGGKASLPVSLFGAVKANQAVVSWLVKYASQEVAARTAQIGAWISLSLYDPALGTVDEKQVNELLAQLQKQGMDAGLLREHIRQGFHNTAEVVECRELMQSVARACQESTLLSSLDEERFHALRATRIVCQLFREVTGKDTEVATGQEVDEALAEAVDAAMPWVRFEQDLALSQKELERELLQLGQASLKIAGHEQADRSWLAKPDQLAAAAKDHDLVRNILFAETRIKELQAEKGDPARIAELNASIATQWKALAGFSPAHLRREPGSSAQPEMSELRAIGLEMDRLSRLPVLHHRVAALQALATPNDKQSLQIKPLMRRLRQIAILQVALESADPEFKPNGARIDRGGGYTGVIVKRLAAFGISTKRQSAFLKNEVQTIEEALGKDERPLGKLISEFDPQKISARLRGALTRSVGGKRGSFTGASASAAASPGAAPLAVSITEGQRRQAVALTSVERQVSDLVLGQAFDIRMGVYGTVSVGSPIVPGLSTSTDVRAERQNGIRVSLEPDGAYVVRVQGGGAVRHGVTLSALSDLINFRGESQVEREKGFDLRFGDRDSCMAMLRGLITGGEVDPAAWSPEQVQRVERQSLSGRASLNAKVDLTLAALSVEAAAAVGSESTVKRSTAGEVETQVRRVMATTTASAQAAAGGASRELSAGLNLSASKTLERQYGMLRPGSQATLSATVVGGNLDRCLDSLFPADADEGEGAQKAQRDAMKQAMKASLARETGAVPDGTELFVRYRLTPTAIREANALLGQASQALTRASLGMGETRQLARNEAADFASQAHAVTRRPDSYALDGWGWTRRDQVEVTRHRGAYQQFARGASAQTGYTAVDGGAGDGVAAGTGASAPAMSASLARLLP